MFVIEFCILFREVSFLWLVVNVVLFIIVLKDWLELVVFKIECLVLFVFVILLILICCEFELIVGDNGDLFLNCFIILV